MGAPAMTKQQLFEYCLNTYGTSPDYPFDEDFETAVLRHGDIKRSAVGGAPIREFFPCPFSGL